MNLKLEIEFSKAELLQEVDALKKQIDDMRPLPEDVEGRVMQKLRLDWNYNSNAIEGNKLSYGETVAFLMEGITSHGKPLKDYLDIEGHNKAINFLLSIVKEDRPFSEMDIRALHEMILVRPYEVKAKTKEGIPTTKTISLGEYKALPNHVETSTGEIHYYATPEETPSKMQELMEWLAEVSINNKIHPVVIAALFHHRFVAIHPFDDGNGRLSRILMNLILMQRSFPPVVVKMEDRRNYYALLNRADNNNSWPFVEYISDRMFSSLQIFMRAAMGGDINEDEDIDKEIALFKIDLKKDVKIKEKKSHVLVNKIIGNEIFPLFRKISDKANEFNEFFLETEKYFEVEIQTGAGIQYWHISLMESQPNAEPPSISTDYINYFCIFKEFKNAKDGFGLSINWKINFNNYNYVITDSSNKEILSKYYDEKLSIEEQRTTIKRFIDELQLSIKRII